MPTPKRKPKRRTLNPWRTRDITIRPGLSVWITTRLTMVIVETLDDGKISIAVTRAEFAKLARALGYVRKR